MKTRDQLPSSLRRGAPDCPACQGIQVLQEKWVLHIVHTLLDGPKGFNAIGREVGGCNPTTLTQRLARLESLGLIAKIDAGEPHANGTGNGNGRRACYALTESGRRLEDVIVAIRRWAEGNLPKLAER
jgi:DNA-binding HxlR family transcriptional regulator